MFIKKTKTIIFSSFIMAHLLCANAFCANEYRIKNLMIDNSDKLILIQGEGTYKNISNSISVPLPQSNPNQVNIINDLSYFTTTSPNRFVIDIPNAIVESTNSTHKAINSKYINSIDMIQYSLNPSVVRLIVNPQNGIDAKSFKLYADGKNIVLTNTSNIVENSIQYKFYTPLGDMDKNATLNNTYFQVADKTTNQVMETIPSLKTKYYLSRVSQNSDGLIIRGLGTLALQRINYLENGTKAVFYLDNATLSARLEDKTFEIPSSKGYNANIKFNQATPKKIKVTLSGDNLKDYRLVYAPDGQSIFISHRTYVLNTIFSNIPAKVNSYNITKNANGYYIFDINLNNPISVDILELNDNFYLDINNLPNFDETLFKKALGELDIDIQAMKISQDKTRYIINAKNLNFAYANLESNAKSVKLCFKEKAPVTIASTQPIKTTTPTPTPATPAKIQKIEKPTIIYTPKEEETVIQKIKKKKEAPQLSTMRKVVLDAGHGGNDCGAIGGGFYEKDLNLTIAKLIQEKLIKKNIYVYMTRSKDTTLSLSDRTAYSNELNPDIFVSIHTNSTLQEDSYGVETHYYKDDSYELAKTIHESFASDKNLEKWDTKNRGMIKSRFYVINHTDAPSVLIEVGFISNNIERTKLLTKERQEEIANSIAKGILEYLKYNDK